MRHIYSRFPLFSIAVVVIAFFLCWAPFHAQRLGYVYFKESKVFRTINEYLMYLSGICYYVSSTINPILYNVMSAKYRQAFSNTLCGITQQQPPAQVQQARTYYGNHKSSTNGHQQRQIRQHQELLSQGRKQESEKASTLLTAAATTHDVMVRARIS